MGNIAAYAKKIALLSDEAKKYYDYEKELVKNLKISKDKTKILKGKQEKEFLQQYDAYVLYLINQMKKELGSISNELESEKQAISLEHPAETAIKQASSYSMPLEAPVKAQIQNKRPLDIDSDAFYRFIKSKKKKKKDILVLKDYTLYEQSSFGRLANAYVGSISQRLIKNHPEFFNLLFNSIKSSDFQILGNTYISIIIFSSMLAFIPFFLAALVLIKGFILIKLLGAILVGILFSALAAALLYAYPSMIITSRRRYMEADLPFVVVHMAAVAGSGAHPIAMFNLILSSAEYKGLESEIKKIINYVNLFGYNLTTSLRLVATTTPLKEFSELLSGIVTTVETGGDLKNYLNIKANETMERYKSKREKYVQNLATFSDIYIGFSLVAPMLFFMLLSMINIPILGGSIAGFSAGTLGVIGTYVVIPILNIIFLIVLSTITPK